jgi:predicted PurR-regulated permease PerM
VVTGGDSETREIPGIRPGTNNTLRHWLTAAAAVVAVGLAVWLILRPFVGSILWAAILAFLMYPLQQRVTRLCGGRPSVAAGLLTGLTPVAIFVPLTLLGLAFAGQISALAASVQGDTSLLDLEGWTDPGEHPRLAQLVTWFTERFNVQLADIQLYLRQGVQDWAGTIARSSGLLFLGTAGMILKFFVMLFVLFFMLRDGAQWFARTAALLPLPEERRGLLLTRLGKVLRAVVYGCGLTALVQGTLVAIGFAIAGLPGFIVFGVLAAVCGLLPFGGAALVWAPAVLYLFGSGQIGWGIFLLAWGAVVSTSDNFIRPVIISRYTPVPTLLVFLGVIGGVGAFGALGFILGPVVLVLAVELFRFAEGSVKRGD